MGEKQNREAQLTAGIAAALPLPLLLLDASGVVLFVNPAAEQFIRRSAALVEGRALRSLGPMMQTLSALAEQARERGAAIHARDINLGLSSTEEWRAGIIAAPAGAGDVLLVIIERESGRRFDAATQQGRLQALNGMAAVLAHEIKNPLAGIRGAAQLLEDSVAENERPLTQLICAESDRIRALIDRMEEMGSTAVHHHQSINIHEVLDRACGISRTGFAQGIAVREVFDPSLPPVMGDKDRLIQALLNLLRNAAEALPERGGEIVLTTAYRSGVHVRTHADKQRSLPLEITVRDNGAGIAPDLLPHIFDPFVTTKSSGSGLGLALVAKIVSEHRGTIECESVPGQTVFRVRFPAAKENGA